MYAAKGRFSSQSTSTYSPTRYGFLQPDRVLAAAQIRSHGAKRREPTLLHARRWIDRAWPRARPKPRLQQRAIVRGEGLGQFGTRVAVGVLQDRAPRVEARRVVHEQDAILGRRLDQDHFRSAF